VREVVDRAGLLLATRGVRAFGAAAFPAARPPLVDFEAFGDDERVRGLALAADAMSCLAAAAMSLVAKAVPTPVLMLDSIVEPLLGLMVLNCWCPPVPPVIEAKGLGGNGLSSTRSWAVPPWVGCK